MFEPGHKHAPRTGRRKGTPAKLTRSQVRGMLKKRGVDPVAEILKLIPELEDRDQMKSWFELLSYCHSKPKPVKSTAPANLPPDPAAVPEQSAPTAQLLSLAGPSQPKQPAEDTTTPEVPPT